MRPILPILALVVLAPVLRTEEYKLGPDSQRQAGVPQGVVTKYSWTSKIYPGTTRNYWIYVPAQYDAAKPACLMVFQDGGGFVNETGGWRATIVLDNLIQRKELPVTVSVFVDPGVLTASSTATQQNRYNRSYEYDALGDRYARFLTEEFLPEITKKYNISTRPDDRAVIGSSSGGIAAFTAAWERPDAFRRVMSFVGSYTDLRGGDYYPSLIRKMEQKPLRVFLQDGSNDQNIYGGNWFLANQSMFSALQYAGYEVNFAVGTEGHNAKHGGAILPDAMRWLWKDYPKPVAKAPAPTGPRHAITEILDRASDWEAVSTGHQFTEGPAVNRTGEVYFVDTNTPKGSIYQIDASGKTTVFKEDAGHASGLMFGPDGRLYAAQNGRKRIVTYSPEGKEAVLAEGVSSNDLAVTSKGAVYFTDPGGHRVWYIDPKGAKRVVHEGSDISMPNGIRLSADESLLLVADTLSRWVWSFQIQADGSLANAQAFYHLELPDDVTTGPLRSGADGMTLDTEGFLYVTTKMGIQVCDQAGRVVAILSKPSVADPSNIVFGGQDLQTLYVTAGDKVYRRHILRKGFYPWTPMKPPMPRL